MKTSTAAAIKIIADRMADTAARAQLNPRDYSADAAELFEDCAEATRDMIVAGLHGLDYAATAYTELGFGSVVAANLARATLLFLDGRNRATQVYVDEVAQALS